ncbi:hypothetical protein KDL01_13050 [Actinospica durhamensis]|uniref:Glycosyltransferase RgtA/B/C/D-like domain-containing protein n=1 Tax=Actinospica durhamensis TaxID=1508375 RepID=A0A941IMI0_9ACTN|nr:hypothetical protein [Actinospica durhamensis]MBR7834195.1 hypothetical protein [Actinospica durhamensis]
MTSSTTEQQAPDQQSAPARFAAARGAVARSARRAWPAMAAYLAARLVSTLVFGLLSSGHGYASRGMFVYVDSGWYQQIALRGYDTAISPNLSPFAFDPLYPGLMGLGHTITGLSVTAIGLAVTWIAALACAWALSEIGALVRDARTGLIFAVLWSLMPSAVIQGALYADTLAICLSAWALYALLRRNLVTAAVLACLAGSTRPTANAIVATVCVGAVVEFLRARRQGTSAGWRPWAAFVIAPLGSVGFLSYVAYRMGSLGGYMRAQKKWGTGFGNSSQVLHRIKLGLEGSTHGGYDTGQAHITTAVLLIVPFLILAMFLQRQPWQLLTYTCIVAVIIYTAIHDYSVVPREMLAAFPLLLAPAGWLASLRRRWVVWVVLGVLAVAAGWYAGYIPIDGGPGYP